jgi:hypothetical protein
MLQEAEGQKWFFKNEQKLLKEESHHQEYFILLLLFFNIFHSCAVNIGSITVDSQWTCAF